MLYLLGIEPLTPRSRFLSYYDNTFIQNTGAWRLVCKKLLMMQRCTRVLETSELLPPILSCVGHIGSQGSPPEQHFQCVLLSIAACIVCPKYGACTAFIPTRRPQVAGQKVVPPSRTTRITYDNLSLVLALGYSFEFKKFVRTETCISLNNERSRWFAGVSTFELFRF